MFRGLNTIFGSCFSFCLLLQGPGLNSGHQACKTSILPTEPPLNDPGVHSVVRLAGLKSLGTPLSLPQPVLADTHYWRAFIVGAGDVNSGTWPMNHLWFRGGHGTRLRWKSACLAHRKPWGPSPAPHAMGYDCNPSTWGETWRVRSSKSSFAMECLRPAGLQETLSQKKRGGAGERCFNS